MISWRGVIELLADELAILGEEGEAGDPSALYVASMQQIEDFETKFAQLLRRTRPGPRLVRTLSEFDEAAGALFRDCRAADLTPAAAGVLDAAERRCAHIRARLSLRLPAS